MARIPTLPSMDSINPDMIGSDTASLDDSKRLSMPPLLTGDSRSPFLRLREDNEKKSPKIKSKHNLAAFGAKLSSTAASVGAHAAKYANRDTKEFIREELLSEGNSSPGVQSASLSGPGTLKSKMFKQSRQDLKSLRIKTDLGIQSARASLSERSPMGRGGSTRELDRIAAIGLPASPAQLGDYSVLNPASLYTPHHTHYPHLSFRKRDSPAAVLSSSASNSTLASEGALYNFNASNQAPQSAGLTSIHSFKTLEEGLSFLQSSWTLLTLRIQPVFRKDESVRIPVEDANILILMHFSAHHSLGGSGADVLKKLDELLTAGMQTSSVVPLHPSAQDIAKSWQLFHNDTLVALEAIFLPLQLEFDGIGQVLTSPKEANAYWHSHQLSSKPAHYKHTKLTIRKRILLAYRDVVIMPTLQHLKRKLQTENSKQNCTEMLQCFMTLHLLQTSDATQQHIDDMLHLVSA